MRSEGMNETPRQDRGEGAFYSDPGLSRKL